MSRNGYPRGHLIWLLAVALSVCPAVSLGGVSVSVSVSSPAPQPSGQCPPGTRPTNPQGGGGYPSCIPTLSRHAPQPSHGQRAKPHGRCVNTRDGATLCNPERDGICLSSMDGVFCSPRSGGVAVDRKGEVLCGAGDCAGNAFGEVLCSPTTGGAASNDGRGGVVCQDGCVPGDAKACVPPVRLD